MKLYPLMPLIFMAAYAFVGISIAIQDPGTAAIGLAVLIVFIFIYLLTKKFSAPAQ
jgi:basic amino acid/polyamine antiporter, APA family